MGECAPDEYQQTVGEVHRPANGRPIGTRHAQLEDHLLQKCCDHLAETQKHSRNAQQQLGRGEANNCRIVNSK